MLIGTYTKLAALCPEDVALVQKSLNKEDRCLVCPVCPVFSIVRINQINKTNQMNQTNQLLAIRLPRVCSGSDGHLDLRNPLHVGAQISESWCHQSERTAFRIRQ